MQQTKSSAPSWEGGTPSVLRTLLYFNLFQHPLSSEEVFQTISIPSVSRKQVVEILDGLHREGTIGFADGYYFLPGHAAIVEKRKAGNQRATQYYAQATKMARRMGKFPFVRAVMVSGSLSKGVMKPDGDIDYFVITDPGRLWIARTLLILYKKFFLLNSHEYWCVNYFVDTDHLEIEDKNLFTATELKWLLPVWNPVLYHTLLHENKWANEWFPNFSFRETNDCQPYRRTPLKKFGEWMLSGKLGDKLDAWCMRKTLQRWQAKFGHFSQEKFEITLRSRKYVSKHHPSDFQQQVRARLKQDGAALSQQSGVELQEDRFFDQPALHQQDQFPRSSTLSDKVKVRESK